MKNYTITKHVRTITIRQTRIEGLLPPLGRIPELRDSIKTGMPSDHQTIQVLDRVMTNTYYAVE